MIISFCGHADFVTTSTVEVRMMEILEKYVGESSAELLLGGYGAFDGFAYNCGVQYKKTHPKIKLVFVTPYIDRADNIGRKYDEIIYPPLENVPYRFAISHRNKWMMQKADIVIAYVEREHGGAFATLKQAKRFNKIIVNLAK